MKGGLKEYKSILLNDLTIHLKSRGFKKSGHNFSKKVNDLIYFIQVQSSQSSSSETFKFTLNIGIGSMKIYELEEVDVPSYIQCHCRHRIGFYMNPKNDHWWNVGALNEAKKSSEEVIHLLVTKVLPDLEQYKFTNDLVIHWESGEYSGLTDGQRKHYLQILQK